ncbi:MAG: hypothetical protein PVH28_12215 [Desulfobacterales bacterium]|jgi:hypothetical protein
MDETSGNSLQNRRSTIRYQAPGKRLELIANLMIHMHNGSIDQNVAAEVLKRIQSRMDQADGEICDDSKPPRSPGKKTSFEPSPHPNLTDQDVVSIAANFEISARDAQTIIRLYQNCFDNRGNFLKTAFEKNVPKFARHEKKVFEILWEFLKETPRRNNRLPFLNSLQIMVGEIKTPIQAIKVLLTDFTQRPEGVQYPDRNAMMLINQLLRDYNKEAILDIEMTPEEVLLVKSGLDKKVVNYVAWKVDGEPKPFQQKTATIRKRITEAMDPDLSEQPLWPMRFLLALEREVHIFLALVGGKTALKDMRSALNDYGNPALFYRLKKSPDQVVALLSHLAAIIRGLGRLGCQSDLALLDKIKTRQDQFMDLNPDRRYQMLVRHVMGLIDASKAAICSRSS